MSLRALLVVVLLFLGGVNANAETYTTTEVGELDSYLGDPNAPVKVVIYSSLTCGLCKETHEEFLTSLNTYIRKGDIVYIFRHYPLDNVAYRASLLATCQRNNEDSFMVIESVFKNQKDFQRFSSKTKGKEVERLLRDVTGIPFNSVNVCIGNEKNQEFIIDRYNEAIELGVSSTPTIFVNGQKFTSQNRDKIDLYIESLLN